MHYLDPEQLEHNILKIIVYTHGQSDTDETHFAVSSIQECRYFQPILLAQIFDRKKSQKFFKKFPRILELKQEEWWLVTLKQTDWNAADVIDIKNVSDISGPLDFTKLH